MNKYDKVEKMLLEFGLTQKQAKVYLAGLECGASSVQTIANQAGIERTNTYDSIQHLIQLRLMSVTTNGKRHLFVAEAPEALERILEAKRANLKDMLPELRSIYNISEIKPRIRYFPGVEGFKAVYEDILTCREKKMLGIFAMRDFLEVAGKDFLNNMVEARVRRGIDLKVIRSHEREVKDLYLESKYEKRELRFAPEGMVFGITTFVYDDKVIYLSSKKETFGMIIESPDIAGAHRNYFEALWQMSNLT